MPGFFSVANYAAAEAGGRTHFCSLRKVPSQASVAGNWVDLSMSAGNPKPQYYASAPLKAAVLDPFDGVFHGDNKAPASKHLTHLGLMTPTAALVGQYKLMDYVLYYPFVDGDSLDEQLMDNTVTLPRYADGDGVMVMAVASAPTTGGGQFTFNYTNHSGALRTSPVINCNTTPCGIATLATSEQAQASGGTVLLPLLNGCRGVQRIESVTFTTPSGGLLALVLVRPLRDIAIREINTMAEIEAVTQRPGAPQVLDGAYLNFIHNCAGTVAAGQLAGYAKFAWST
jgi:hypothetical protein